MANYIKGEKARAHIVECAAQLFIKKGYHATGVNDVLESAGLSKGSFYFHFKSKKALATAVYDYFAQWRYSALMAAAQEPSWDDFVDHLIGFIMEKTNENENFGCPLAVMGMEIAFSEPDIAERCANSFQQWVAVFHQILRRSGLEEAWARELAEQAFAVYEGYLLLYRINKDALNISNMIRDMKRIAAEALARRLEE